MLNSLQCVDLDQKIPEVFFLGGQLWVPTFELRLLLQHIFLLETIHTEKNRQQMISQLGLEKKYSANAAIKPDLPRLKCN